MIKRTILIATILCACASTTYHQEIGHNQRSTSRSEVNQTHFKWHQQAHGGVFFAFPNITAYVSKVGKRVARVSDYPKLGYEFVIVNQSTPHALSLLDGKIAINRGLLTELGNEAELAAILAKNIALSPILYSKKAQASNALLNMGISQLRKAYLNSVKFTPLDLETELLTDRKAIEYLVGAGYDPSALLTVNAKLARWQEIQTDYGLHIQPFAKERRSQNEKLISTYQEGGYLGQTSYQEAIRPLLQDLEAYHLYERGQIAYASEDFALALDLAHAALAINPIEISFKLLEGRACLALQLDKEALLAFNSAIQLNPEYYLAYFERGKFYQMQNELNKAVYDFEQSIKRFPTPKGYLHLANVLQKQGEIKKAVLALEVIRGCEGEEGKIAHQLLEEMTRFE